MLNKKIKALIILLLFVLSQQQNSLKFLEMNRNSEFIRGIISYEDGNYALLKDCLSEETENLDKILKEISVKNYHPNQNEFVEKARIFLTQLPIVFKKCKSIPEPLKIIVELSSNYFFYIPQNLATILANYLKNKSQIIKLIEEMINPFIIGKNITKILTIIMQNANFKDEGLQSYQEFKLFDNCFSSIIAEIQYEGFLFVVLLGLITGETNLDYFFNYIKQMAIIFNNGVDYCTNYYHHVLDLAK